MLRIVCCKMVSSIDINDTQKLKSAPARARDMDVSDMSEPEDTNTGDSDLLAKLEAMQRTLREQEEKIAAQEQRMKHR